MKTDVPASVVPDSVMKIKCFMNIEASNHVPNTKYKHEPKNEHDRSPLNVLPECVDGGLRWGPQLIYVPRPACWLS